MKPVISWYNSNETVANPEKSQLKFIGLKDGIKVSIDIKICIDEDD